MPVPGPVRRPPRRPFTVLKPTRKRLPGPPRPSALRLGRWLAPSARPAGGGVARNSLSCCQADSDSDPGGGLGLPPGFEWAIDVKAARLCR